MSGGGNYCPRERGPAQRPGRSGPPAAARKYRSASEPSRPNAMVWRRRTVRTSTLSGRTRAVPGSRCLIARCSRSCHVRFLAKQDDSVSLSARRAGARSTSVAPQQRRNASLWRQNTSPQRATNCFVTDAASQLGGCNSPRFLSMQRPKPVDTEPPMSGF